jgi:serine/threonine-protein kinase SRPK3
MRLIRNDERALDAHAPRAVVAPIEMEKFDEAGLLREDIVVIGLKSSFVAGTISPMYDVRYANNYRAPELLLQTELTQAVDIWALACLIFDTRAGRPFFHSIWHVNDVLEEIVSRRGRLPEHLWSSWKNRSEYFHENGVAKEPYDYPSIRNELERVATDDWKLRWEHTLLDQLGNRIPQEEVMLLDDLLGKMLRCDPDERITIDEVISHPWFAFR